jgi:hypothetical protein
VRVGRKKRLEPCKLLVIQPEKIANHHWSPFGDRESQPQPFGNPFNGSGP